MINLSTTFSRSLKNGKAWVIIMMLIGAVLTIVYKFQNTMLVSQGPFYKQNFHPYLQVTWYYIQTINMFIGQMLSLPIFFFLKYRHPQKYKQKQRKAILQGKKINMNRLYLLIPTIFDLLTSTMQYIALNFISGSVYQMIKGGTIITTFLFSITLLKNPLLRRQLLGSALAVIGIVTVGLANVLFTSNSYSQTNIFLQIAGYILMILSLLTNGLFFVVEQKLMQKYHLQPLQIVGFQGLFGFLIYLVIIPILCFIPCYFGQDACVFSQQGFAYMQGFTSYITQLRQNPSLIGLGIIVIFGIFIFNVAGVSVTKYINALARAIANMTKSIIVWILGLIITLWLGDTYPNLKWQKLQKQIIILQIVGFIFMALGNFIYSDIIKVPGLKQKNIQPKPTLDFSKGQSQQISQQRLIQRKNNQQNS